MGTKIFEIDEEMSTPPLCDDILLWAGKAQGYSLYVAVPGSAGRGDVRKIRIKCENFW